MMRRRKRVYTEGQLRRFAELFIAPLAHYRGARTSFPQFIEQFFHVDTRFILMCQVKEHFSIAGRLFKPGDNLLVRHDTTTPELFELSTAKGEEMVFAVQKLEWIKVKRKLIVTDKICDGVEEVFG
jgi:hypothetical protein